MWGRPVCYQYSLLIEDKLRADAEVTTAPAVQFPGRIEAIQEVSRRRVEFRFSVKHVQHVGKDLDIVIELVARREVEV